MKRQSTLIQYRLAHLSHSSNRTSHYSQLATVHVTIITIATGTKRLCYRLLGDSAA